MKALLRWIGLVAFAALALELFFVLRIAAMAVVNPESTTFQRSEAWAQLASDGPLRWRQQWVPYGKISDHLNFFQQSLGLRAKKVEVIASNIANADTPGYKAVDFDFGKALQGQLRASQSGLALATSNERHLAAQGHASVDDGGLQYRSAVQPSLDGNTVDMDRERASFADNAVKYEATLRFINGSVRTMLDAMKSHNQG